MTSLNQILDSTFSAIENTVESHQAEITLSEIGTVIQVDEGVARITGLPGVQSEELVQFPGGLLGLAFNLDPGEVGIVLMGKAEKLEAGAQVRRTGRVADIPVGESLLGRVIDSIGRPIDDGGPFDVTERWPIERSAPGIMDRSPVSNPLQTGIKAIDSLIPIGRGQRELIVGDRQTGKTAVAVDTIINQRDKDVICVYCSIGQPKSAVARTIADLENYQAMDYTVVVAATGENTPGLIYFAPYAATSIAEYFREQGEDVLIVYDDLTRHARAYRELSLLLRRPPGREAYPGDIFYIHSRLLERATQLSEENGGGSLTALPIIETQAQNISAYIPTNLISITDGQIYLSPTLFRQGILPPIDTGRSVSRVGGKAQLPAYQKVTGDLRLAYSQFRELESFARFGTRLDEETRQKLNRGRRVREVLKQPQYRPLPVAEQIAIFVAVTEGILDPLPLERIQDAEKAIRQAVVDRLPDTSEDIQQGQELDEGVYEELVKTIREAVQPLLEEEEEREE
jgi:F-type H+-transporting ATPase subunit alpha